MTEREMQAVGDFLATLSPWMVAQLAKPEAAELAKNELLARAVRTPAVGASPVWWDDDGCWALNGPDLIGPFATEAEAIAATPTPP